MDCETELLKALIITAEANSGISLSRLISWLLSNQHLGQRGRRCRGGQHDAHDENMQECPSTGFLQGSVVLFQPVDVDMWSATLTLQRAKGSCLKPPNVEESV